MVYIARKKNGSIVHHTDLKAMKGMDGIEKADLIVTDAEFEAVSGLIRLINGKIVLGKTKAEQDAETERAGLAAEKDALQKELDDKL